MLIIKPRVVESLNKNPSNLHHIHPQIHQNIIINMQKFFKTTEEKKKVNHKFSNYFCLSYIIQTSMFILLFLRATRNWTFFRIDSYIVYVLSMNIYVQNIHKPWFLEWKFWKCCNIERQCNKQVLYLKARKKNTLLNILNSLACEKIITSLHELENYYLNKIFQRKYTFIILLKERRKYIYE